MNWHNVAILWLGIFGLTFFIVGIAWEVESSIGYAAPAYKVLTISSLIGGLVLMTLLVGGLI